MHGDVAVLVGNGLSVAYNQDLALGPLIKEIKRRYGEDGGDRLAAYASTVTGNRGDALDFEDLLSPFDDQRDALTALGYLMPLVAADRHSDVEGSLTMVKTFVKELHREGVGHAPEVIDQRSRGCDDAVVDDFVCALSGIADGGRVHLATLNYDSLLMAALLRGNYNMCDMAVGYGDPGCYSPIAADQTMCGRNLRQVDDFPYKHFTLLQLHGSLAWLRDPTSGADATIRFAPDDLRGQDYWACWRRGETEWEPQVILTNQHHKSEMTSGSHPFRLAYDKLMTSLMSSDQWIVAGYSFHDLCVNDVFARALSYRTALRKSQQVIDIVDYRDDVTVDRVKADLNAHRDSEDVRAEINVFRKGIAACSADQLSRAPDRDGLVGLP